MWKKFNSADAFLWSEVPRDNPELSLKSKQGQPNKQTAVWTRGDRAAKLSSQLGAQIDGQDRNRICVNPPLWLCLSGTKLLFEQVTCVKECIGGIINEDMLRGYPNSIMTFPHVHQNAHREPSLHVWATSGCICLLKAPDSITDHPHTCLKTVQPFHIKTRPLI